MEEIELYKPNELIGAIDQIEVSRTAKHLLNYLLQYAQLELNKALKNKEVHGNKFEVSVSQINGLAEFQKHDYERLKRTLITLMQPVILRDDPKHFKAIVPVCEIDVNVEKGLYVFSISDTVKEILQNNDYFTKLTLAEFNNLQSKHSIVIYEWLKRYETSPQIPQLTVEELRNITHTVSKAYDNFTNLKQRVLSPAVTEINEHTPYTVSYEIIKERISKYRPKVTAIQFTMTRKKTEKEIAGISEIVSEDIVTVNRRYQALCEQYIQFNFCSTQAEFYKATYKSDYSQLLWFYNSKKDLQQANKLKWLLDDIEKGKRYPRRASQTAYYKSLFDKEDRQSQGQLEYSQSKQGFLEQVLKLQKRHNDNKQIDIEKWL